MSAEASIALPFTATAGNKPQFNGYLLSQTEQVNFHLSGSKCSEGHEEIDGDTWRELEAKGASDEFISLLLKGKCAEEVANLCLATL